MTAPIRVAFAYFWPGFAPEHFRAFFPYAFAGYDLALSNDPEIVFYSVFSPQFRAYADPRNIEPCVTIGAGKYLRVFLTGENFEPAMHDCEFAISFSALTDHANHLRLPLWVYENRGWGYGPERLVKDAHTDWEKLAAEKSRFCNFLYQHDVPFRNAVLDTVARYKPVDSAGPCRNTMKGWTVPMVPNRLQGKLDFFRHYKFTLAVENILWPGYMTEKLVDPMYAASIPIYVGDPQAHLSFNPESYIDFNRFASMTAMLDYVRAVDNDRDLYLKMLAAPFYRANTVPDYARDETIAAFFHRIFETALSRRRG